MASTHNIGDLRLLAGIPQQATSTTYDVLVGADREPGTLTVSTAGDAGIVAVDLRVGKHGSALAALAEATATAVTLGLQHGAPPVAFTGKADRIGIQVVPADA
ncbi:hypothetical protein [Catenulispora acidiphila]|uniref:hypothetical protein n=1 Tax=Catenulispora acidiphila TaxID=304895 RepID=UPI00019DFF3A|nr:hypothetical protein [Catenulispora acidiphila]